MRDAFVRKLSELAEKDSTIFFITHRLASIRNANKILLLKEGKIKESGTHQELIENKNEYFKYYEQQGK